jgi:hypothetical protein
MTPDSRFDGDFIPDATWGICRIHGIVRLVDEEGNSIVMGICVHCWEETRNEKFFSCPVHGIQPKAPGRDGCPVPVKGPDGVTLVDCLGESPGPTEDEIARETESYNRVWPGGPEAQQNVLDASQPGPAVERGGEAREGAQGEAGDVLQVYGRRVEDGSAWRDPFLIEEES